MLGRIGCVLGRAWRDDELATALAGVSRLTNARTRDPSVSWDSIPEGEGKKALGQLALEYGYTFDVRTARIARH